MNYRFLSTERDAGIEYLTLNRPDVRNAFNPDVIAELSAWAASTRAADPGTVRAVVLAGAGKTFCAGADIAWMSKTVHYTEADNLRDAVAMSRMFAALNDLPMPLIGRVHGAALGGGAGLVAVCDIVVSEEQAQFGFTEAKLGILPAVISPFAIAKIGRSAARELFLTGARFDARRAKDIGLVHASVPASDLDAKIAEYVREILTAGPEAVSAAKALIPQVWGRTIEEAMPLTTRAIATRRVSAEGQEGLRAFLEKRAPAWANPTDIKDTKNTGDAKGHRER
jgi:methylglutaconyl-CoA hydratase